MSLDCCSTSPRSRTLSLLLVSNGRALTVAAARSQPLRKRSPALLPLAAVPKRWSREPNHNPVSNRTVTYPPGSCPSVGTGNRTTTRFVTRSFTDFHRTSSPGHASRPSARPPRSTKQPVQECWRRKNSPWPVPSTRQAPLVYRSEFFTHFAILFLNFGEIRLSFGNRKT
jgi:hypothetical protein